MTGVFVQDGDGYRYNGWEVSHVVGVGLASKFEYGLNPHNRLATWIPTWAFLRANLEMQMMICAIAEPSSIARATKILLPRALENCLRQLLRQSRDSHPDDAKSCKRSNFVVLDYP